MRLFYIKDRELVKSRFKIELGDVCIWEGSGVANFCLLSSYDNDGESYKLLESVQYKAPWNSKLLFSIDCIEGRCGDKDALEKLCGLFSNEKITNLINNFIDIVNYRDDKVDAGRYVEILKMADSACLFDANGSKVVQQEEQVEEKVKESPNLLFFDYIDEQMQKFWLEIQNVCHGDRDIMIRVRNEFPERFSKYQRRFMKDHKSLYEYRMVPNDQEHQ